VTQSLPVVRRVGLYALTIGAATGGGALFDALALPLPWMLGSLAASACLALIGQSAKAPSFCVKAGQMTIGLALGLYFTPTVIAALTQMLGWMIGVGLYTCLMSLLGAVFLQRFMGFDGKTSFYAAAIGAASDMAIQAHKAGARGDLVAVSHSIRVAMVVSIIPVIAADLVGQMGVNRSALGSGVLYLPWLQTIVLAVAALFAALLADRIRGFPNVWVLAPLLAALVSAALLPEHRLHPVLVAAGQIMLGWNLGQRFTRELFAESPRLAVAAALMTLAFLGLSLVMALSVHVGLQMNWATSLVATAPGGIAEMAITAKVLNLDPPTVTAFHAVRLVMMVTGADLLMRLGFYLGWLKDDS